MRYIVKSGRLERQDGELIKEFDCPLEKRWEDLMPWVDQWDAEVQTEVMRLCGACSKPVVDFNAFTESQIVGIVAVNPDACGYLRMDHPDLNEVVLGDEENLPEHANGATFSHDGSESSSCLITSTTRRGLRIVHTARSLASIRDYIEKGYVPFFVSNRESGKVMQKRSIVYLNEHHELYVAGDFRSAIPFSQKAIDEEYGKGAGIYLQRDFSKNTSPVAAYMLPEDLENAETVFVEDVIEDHVEASWNQGDTYRLRSCLAVWDGSQLILNVPTDTEISKFVG